MEEKEVLDSVKTEMNEAINKLKGSLATLRAGAVNPNVLDKIRVDYYGEMTPIKTLAAVRVEGGTALVLKVFDPSSVKSIEAGILMSKEMRFVLISHPSLVIVVRKSSRKLKDIVTIIKSQSVLLERIGWIR